MGRAVQSLIVSAIITSGVIGAGMTLIGRDIRMHKKTTVETLTTNNPYVYRYTSAGDTTYIVKFENSNNMPNSITVAARFTDNNQEYLVTTSTPDSIFENRGLGALRKSNKEITNSLDSIL